jgi:hypothetical protein
MIYARQSTAIIVTVGPVLDADGVAVTDGVVGDFVISKNGGAPAALNGSATLTHRNTGHYSLSLTATDVNTVGTVEVIINDTVNACPMKEIQVVEPTTYDVLFADAAPGPASPTNITAGTVTTATNVTTVNGLAAGVITAAAVATGAIDADALSADAGTEIGTAVWATATRVLTANTNLNDPTAATIAAAVWDEDATAHQTGGTFGKAIGDPGADTNTIFKAVVTDATGATVGVDVVAVKSDTAAILADTGTDGVVVAAASKTGYSLTATTGLGNQTSNITGSLSGSVGSVTGAVGSVTGNVGGNVTGSVGSVTGLTASNLDATVSSRATPAQILTTALTEAYAADGAAPTLTQAVMAIQQFLQEKAISGTTLTVKKLDGTTTAMTFTLDSDTAPTSVTRAT